jgi:sugar phosphate isomerase/epimerase
MTNAFLEMNRRDFLKTTGLLPVLAAGGFAWGSAARAFGPPKPVSKFEASAPMQVGLNAYSFAKELNNVIKQRGPGMTLFELLDYCVDPAHRFDSVDITGYYFPNYSASEATVPPDKFVDELKRRAADLGLPISGTGIGNSFTGVPFDRAAKNGAAYSTDEGGDRKAIEKDIERIKAWIEVAARLGAPVLRVFAGLEPSYLMKQNVVPHAPDRAEKAKKLKSWRAETFKRMLDDLGTVVEHGKRFGVIVGIQNHGDFLKTADETIELLAAVSSEWFGAIVDTGYFLTPDPYLDIQKLMPYAVNFQIKEFIRVSPSEYMTPAFQPIELNRLLRIVRRSGYRGYLPIETVSAGKAAPYDPYRDIPPFLAKVRKAIRETV